MVPYVTVTFCVICSSISDNSKDNYSYPTCSQITLFMIINLTHTQPNMYTVILLLLLVFSANCQNTDKTKCGDPAIQRLCMDLETCDQCLQAHPCCNWCYDEVSTSRNQKKYFIYLRKRTDFFYILPLHKKIPPNCILIIFLEV